MRSAAGPHRSRTRDVFLNKKEGDMRPVTNPDDPSRRRSRRPMRVLGALGLAGALAFSASCASSDDSSSSDTTVAADDTNPQAEGVIEFRSLDAGGPQTIGALQNDSIDIAELFTFTPAIAENDWVILEDDKHLQAADNFIPLIRTEVDTDEIGEVLNAVTAALTEDNVMDMVEAVAVDGANPEKVAADFLDEHDFPGGLKASGSLTVGSANFTESEVVGRVYAGALREAGVDVTFKDAVGARQVTMPMMENGDLDLMPEFTYSLLAYLDPDAEPSNDIDEVTTALVAALPDSLSVREVSDVSDVNVFVVTRDTADEHGLKTISDLAGVSETLVLGGPPECPENAACIPGLEKVYGLQFDVK